MASVPGRFVYSPAAGEVLKAGTHTLSAAFTPEDSAVYTTAQAAVSLTITKATPIITWPTPADIFHGEPLSSAQLNATALVSGVFIYRPAAGEVLSAGLHTLLAAFTPTDVEDYAAVQATVPLIVTKATPIVTWPMPSSIVYGAPLGAVELNATASVPGTFVYTPAAGEVLLAGWHTLSVIFTPADAENYAEAQTAVSIRVTQAKPVIAWPVPDSISEDIAISAAQLNATASVPGAFAYTPAAGEALSAGVHTLSAFFTPADEENYAEAQANVPLTVTKAAPAPAIDATPSAVEIQEVSQANPVTREAPAEADAEPTVEVKVEPSVEAAVETPVERAVQQPDEAVVAQPIEALAEPPVEAVAAQPLEPVAEQLAELPAKALAKTAAPKFTFDEGAVMGTAVFKDGTKIYLVMQPGSAGLPSSNRLISQFFATGDPKPEIIINRYRPHSLGVGEEQAGVALTGSEHLPISRLIGQMAGAGSEQPATPEKKSGFSLKRLSQRLWSKIPAAGIAEKFSHRDFDPFQQNAGAATAVTRADGMAHITRSPAQPADSALNGQSEPETRVYKGDTYVLCVDGEWHLDQDRTRIMIREKPAVARPMPAPASRDTAPGSLQSHAKQKPKPARIASAPVGKPASKAKTASAKKAAAKHPAKAVAKKSSVKKAVAKRPIKAAAKKSLVKKAAIKHPVKAAAKKSSTKKAAVKRPVKAAAKKSSTKKAAVKRPVKAAAKKSSTKKAATKHPVKAATKSRAKAPVRKSVPAKKKTLRAKPAKATKPASRTSKPAAKMPSPKQAKKRPAKR
jgi:hypothetical protein